MQGWRRYAARQLAVTAAGEAVLLFFFASDVRLQISGSWLQIRIRTAFPFDDRVYIDATASEALRLWVRVPRWTTGATAWAALYRLYLGVSIARVWACRYPGYGRAGTQNVRLSPRRSF